MPPGLKVTSTGPGEGIVGTTTDPTSTGVAGTGNHLGVQGTGLDADGIGVLGQGHPSRQVGKLGGGPDIGATGVWGTGSTGVAGFGASTGVLGSGRWGVSGSGGHLGVHGRGPTGVWGEGGNLGVFGKGAEGVTSFGRDGSIGVWGEAGSASDGVDAVGLLDNVGVIGHSDGFGVVGQSDDTGVLGKGQTGVSGEGVGTGVFGEGNYGVHGSGDHLGVLGEGGDSTHEYSATGVYGTAGTSGSRYGGIGVVGDADYNNADYGVVGLCSKSGGLALYGQGDCEITGDFVVGGDKSVVVKLRNGDRRALYCMESPESWFEDFGRARLVRGKARVRLDRIFAQVVRTGDYHVFLSPEGPSQGLYISRRTGAGFEVREQQKGTSTVPFSYRIVARRRDVQGTRFKRVKPRAMLRLPRRLKAAAARPKGRKRAGRVRVPAPVRPPEIAALLRGSRGARRARRRGAN